MADPFDSLIDRRQLFAALAAPIVSVSAASLPDPRQALAQITVARNGPPNECPAGVSVEWGSHRRRDGHVERCLVLRVMSSERGGMLKTKVEFCSNGRLVSMLHGWWKPRPGGGSILIKEAQFRDPTW
jgi:hypothetical protein